MLGTRTKKVAAYGKRSHRVVSLLDFPTSSCSEAAKLSSQPTYPAANQPITPTSTPAHQVRVRKVKQVSPRASPKASHICTPKKIMGVRLPLVDRTPNGASPIVISAIAQMRGPAQKRAGVRKIAPFVDIKKVPIAHPGRTTRSRLAEVIVITDDSDIGPPRHRRPIARKATIVLSSDEESDVVVEPSHPKVDVKPVSSRTPLFLQSSDSDSNSPQGTNPSPVPHKVTGTESSSEELVEGAEPESRHLTWNRIPHAQSSVNLGKGSLGDRTISRLPPRVYNTKPIPSKTARIVRSPFASRSRPPRRHPLTPRLVRQFSLSSIATDDTLSTFSSVLETPPPIRSELQSNHNAVSTLLPALADLLTETNQQAPMDFNEFIQMIPLSDLHTRESQPLRQLKKIGEASYSEIFGIGDLVLKIIPLNTGQVPKTKGGAIIDVPYESDILSVIKEIIITRAMGELNQGFIKLLSSYVVKGKYPQILLDLWDEYEHPDQQNLRPDVFLPSELYVIIVLPHAGKDLEAYKFDGKTGWRQACSIFWQVVRALGLAEELARFEHRDLHVGQILVRSLPPLTQPMGLWVPVPMDDLSSGVRATIIDLGLSRMDSRNSFPYYSDFDQEIFEGKGDYQFDIYRMMRDHNGGEWAEFHPVTNIMWLHYLVVKLLKSKQLKVPAARTRRTAKPSISTFSEQDYHACLTEVEKVLAYAIRPRKAVRGRPKMALHEINSTTDLLNYGRARNWMY